MNNPISLRPRRARVVIVLALIMLLLSFNLVPPVRAVGGDLDTTFGKGGKVVTSLGAAEAANAVEIQPDGRILAGGAFNGVDFALVRYMPDGELDFSFGPGGVVFTSFGGGSVIRDIALQPDGKIVSVGDSTFVGTNVDFCLARHNANGSPDMTFGSGGKVVTDFFSDFDNAWGAAIQADGRIVAAGSATKPDGTRDFALARYNPDGSPDNSFGTAGKVVTDFAGSNDLGQAMVLQPDGKIVVAGGAINDFALARYNTNGSLDMSFGVGGKVTTDLFDSGDIAFAIAIQSDGRLVVGGSCGPFFSTTGFEFGLARYNTDGSIDGSFAIGGRMLTDFFGQTDTIRGIGIEPDGKIVAAGTAFRNNLSESQDAALARYNTDGTPDATFGSNGKVTTDFLSRRDEVFAVAIQPDGSIVTAGLTQTTSEVFSLDFALARYLGCTSSLSRSSAFFPTSGGEATVDVRAPAGCPWTASTNDFWITIVSPDNGEGDGLVTYVARDNLSPFGRQGFLTIAGQTLSITQAGTQPCSYSLSPKFDSFSATGGSGSINVICNFGCAWSAQASDKWIEVTSNCCGLGNGTVTYRVRPNDMPAGRTGRISIGGQTFSIKQKGS
ncbi:MAG TPA: hypothetical protein VKA70_01715 [Blastocatellia bacterium]|nr:hypothetical protein [Blastocatellia bacterium]